MHSDGLLEEKNKKKAIMQIEGTYSICVRSTVYMYIIQYNCVQYTSNGTIKQF